jgi:hypothetical protein
MPTVRKRSWIVVDVAKYRKRGSKIALKEDTRPSLLKNQKATVVFAGKN